MGILILYLHYQWIIIIIYLFCDLFWLFIYLFIVRDIIIYMFIYLYIYHVFVKTTGGVPVGQWHMTGDPMPIDDGLKPEMRCSRAPGLPN